MFNVDRYLDLCRYTSKGDLDGKHQDTLKAFDLDSKACTTITHSFSNRPEMAFRCISLYADVRAPSNDVIIFQFPAGFDNTMFKADLFHYTETNTGHMDR